VPPKADALDRLNAALNGLARALESGSAESVLSAEGPLAAALDALATGQLEEVSRRPDLRAAVMNVRLALERCQTLGESAASIAAALGQPGYDAHGLRRPDGRRASTIGTRT
jgi:hypothetical protein